MAEISDADADRALKPWIKACERTLDFLRKNPDVARAFGGVVGFSDAFHEVLERAQAFAPDTSPVFICGETGTGKEAVARAIHLLSGRPADKWHAHSCGAQSREEMQRSELFGHTKGSFTGATQKKDGLFKVVDGGSLFLDEIGALDWESQKMLNRAVERDREDGLMHFVPLGATRDEKVDVRIITAYNKHLALDSYLRYQLFAEQEGMRTGTIARFKELERRLAKIQDETERAFLSKELEDLRPRYERAEAWEGAEDRHLYLDTEKGKEQFAQYTATVPGLPFNEDLGHRLMSLTIFIPPLCSRPLDAMAIAIYYIEKMGVRMRNSIVQSVMENCQVGNVRTIKSVLKEYLLLRKYRRIRISECQRYQSPELWKNIQREVGGFWGFAIGKVHDYVRQLQNLWDGPLLGSSRGRRGRHPKYANKTPKELAMAIMLAEGNVDMAAKQSGFADGHTFREYLEKHTIPLPQLLELEREAVKNRNSAKRPGKSNR